MLALARLGSALDHTVDRPRDRVRLLELGVMTELRQAGERRAAAQLEDGLEDGLGADWIAARPGELQPAGPVAQRAVPALRIADPLVEVERQAIEDPVAVVVGQ